MRRIALTCWMLLIAATATAETPQAIPVLIVTGANNHDWEWTSARLETMLEANGLCAADITREPAKDLADAARIAKYRAFVLDYNGPRWGDAAERNFLAAVAGGAGVAVIHAANNAFDGWQEYERLVGHCWRAGTGHGKFHPFNVQIVDRAHPITRNLPDLVAHPDELYHKLVHMHGAEARVLGVAHSSTESGGTGAAEPMIITLHYGLGRVFHTPLGHVWKDAPDTRPSFEDPQFQTLVRRGVEWAATGEVKDAQPDNQLSEGERAAGWRLLFDGQSFAGWRGYRQQGAPAKGWVVDNGKLQVQAGGGGGDLVTVQKFGDFELQLEWLAEPGANSGIIFRVSEEFDTPWQTGPEFQLLDDEAHKDLNPLHGAGALYDLIEPLQEEVQMPSGRRLTGSRTKPLRPAGSWNRARIVLHGGRLEHWLNDRKIASGDLDGAEFRALVAASKFAVYPRFALNREGHIALQDHGNNVWFRNVKIRPLETPVMNETRLFNGKDLAGWTFFSNEGAPIADVWRVENGVLICKGTPNGYIRTVANYTNYVLKLDWRWSPITKAAGNSGVLLRMEAPDKVWPASVEAQLMSGRAGDFWNIGGYALKVDAERTKGGNTRQAEPCENPVGEWNHYEILVSKDRVLLKVNGKIVNEAFNAPELAGPICLQSEGAEIHFKDIVLLPVDDGGAPKQP
ncbi:MAG: family 16 glycoside hydrolase [Planctomycetota bacterium]